MNNAILEANGGEITDYVNSKDEDSSEIMKRAVESGYMQRRLVNALQDLQVKPSGLVTDNQGNVIQTMFGEDGVDPAKSDSGKVADLDKLIQEIRSK